ncbi:MAG TPA: glycine cleavage system protein H [Thermoanaerobaculia bacterium]|nr:glycine cleavage system protein H [Thermoanaerobaculia bacterium]
MSEASGEGQLRYRRARFIARFPRHLRYSASHYWLEPRAEGLWRIGYTTFALRMLGEAVEVAYEVEPEAPVELGQVIGWFEGLKAVTDLFAPMAGRFVRDNPALRDRIELIDADPYGGGWFFEMRGTPGVDCVDAEGYARLLDSTIDRMQGEES